MGSLVKLARRELAERRNVLAVGAILALVPLGGPWLMTRVGHGEARGMLLLVLLCAYLPALAVMVGSSVLGRDLAQRRLGFYFVRPLNGLSIYAGKVAGGLVLVGLTALVLCLPASLAGVSIWSTILANWDVGQLVLLWLGLLLGAFFVAHFAGVALRSRSGWMLVDVAALTALSLLAYRALRALRDVHAEGPLAAAMERGLVGVAAAVLAAGAAGVVSGHGDIRRSHRVQSTWFWSATAAAVLAVTGYSAWVRAASPRDLAEVHVAEAAPAGPWLAASGPARGFEPMFLVDRSDPRRFHHLPQYNPRAFSASGNRAAWIEDDRTVVTVRLDAAGAEPHRTRIEADSRWDEIELSPDGERLGLLSKTGVQVYDLGAERLLASAALPEPCKSYKHGRLRFVGSERVRVFRPKDCVGLANFPQAVFDLDVARKELSQVGGVDGPVWGISDDGERVVLFDHGALYRADAHTGERLPPGLDLRSNDRLADGRAVAVEVADGRARLRLASAAGAPEREIDLGPAARAFLLGEVAPGRVLVDAFPGSGEGDERQALVDVERGTVRSLPVVVRPVSGWGREPDRSPHLFHSSGQIVELDVESGTTRPLVEALRRR